MFLRFYAYCSLLLIFVSLKTFATCSPHVGNATLNEIMKEGGNNGGAFIEIELLDTSIPPVTYDNWKVRVCYNEGSGNNCNDISVANMNDATQWVWAEEPVIDSDYLDFKYGYDLALLDENNLFIDYIEINGYSGQNFTNSCGYADLDYVFTIPNEITNGTKILLRKLDGMGEWQESKNLNEYSPTPGENNDGDPSGPVLAAHYQMDEETWLIGGKPIIDSVNNFNGAAYNGANTVGSTCRYGQFDGIDDYIQIPHDDVLNGSDALTYVAYIRADSWTGVDQIMAKSVHGGGSGRAQMGVFSENGVFKVRAETVDGRKEINDTLPVAAGDWVHVAAVFSNTSLTLYIDGVNVASTTFSSTTLQQTTDPLNISKRVGTDQYYFHGLIDDVRIYTSSLTHQEVVDLMNSVQPCSLSPVDHFEINHDGSGLTCEAETITIKACANADCSMLNHDDNDVQLSINNTVDQTVTVSGGSTETNFSYVNVGAVTLSLDQTYECKNVGSTNCDIVFDNTGFIFGHDSNNTPVIPTQLSGKPSNIGFHNEKLFLQAVKTDDNTGTCVGIFPTGDDISVNLSYTCHDDSSDCTSDLVLTNNERHSNLNAISTAHNLRFDDNSKAYFSLNYPDAGKLIVNAQKNIDVDGLIKNFNQSSNAFVVKPFGIKLDFSQDINFANAIAENEGDSVFKKAGESFTVRATAVQWVFGEDDDADGEPDDLINLNDNMIAKHFDAETLTYSPVLVLPASGTLGTLTPETSNDFTDSIADNNYNYSEVGIINLTVSLSDADYLFTGNIYGQVNNVGRFIPDNFKLTHSFVDNSCGNVTYMDEPAIELTYEIEARNSAGEITLNYTEGFAKSAVSLVAENNNDGVDLAPVRLTGYAGSWVDGLYKNEVDKVTDIDLVTFIRDVTPVVDGPYDNLLFGIKLTATEGAVLNNLDMLTDTAKILSSTESKIRFGRWVIENTFGPETRDLPVPMSIQYWDGNDFVINSLDNCTTFDAAKLTIDNSDIAPATTAASGTGSFVNGITRKVILSAPGASNQGAVPVNYVIPSMPWLLYDWTWNGVDAKDFSENPSAVATFGLFRGNDRIIYQREVH